MTTPAHGDRDKRRGIWRALDLVGPAGTFMRRRGVDLRAFGVYVHRIDQPDPGLDLHDHPWPFVTFVLRGGYCDEAADARLAQSNAQLAEAYPSTCTPGAHRCWKRWSVHRVRMTDAHRITHVQPRTVTLVLRGRKSRAWGFFMPAGWLDQSRYDYRARRPLIERRR